jgi:mono/diheme cytochrome c family protein
MATGRPQVVADAYYSKTGKPWTAMPGPYGAHNWQPMSFSKKTGYVYIPVIESLFTYVSAPEWKPSVRGYNIGIMGLEMPSDPAIKAQVLGATKGILKAWDPVAKKEVWSVPLAGMWNGGVLSTGGGLVFQGSADGTFSAYDATNGSKLWTFATQAGVLASPVSYALGNEQYIAVLVGWGGAAIAGGETLDKGALEGNRSRVLAFKLGGTAQLPAAPPPPVPQTAPPPRFGSEAVNTQGSAHFHMYCTVCHGNAAVSAGGVIPDLRWSKALGDAEAWKKIVIDGSRAEQGMVSYAPVLSAEQAEAVRAYVVSRANDTYPGAQKAQ